MLKRKAKRFSREGGKTTYTGRGFKRGGDEKESSSFLSSRGTLDCKRKEHFLKGGKKAESSAKGKKPEEKKKNFHSQGRRP